MKQLRRRAMQRFRKDSWKQKRRSDRTLSGSAPRHGCARNKLQRVHAWMPLQCEPVTTAWSDAHASLAALGAHSVRAQGVRRTAGQEAHGRKRLVGLYEHPRAADVLDGS